MSTEYTNNFKQRLYSGEKLVGCWSSLAHSITTEILGMIGFDWILIDCEHAPNDIQSCLHQLNALKGSKSSPVVRPPSNDGVAIKRLLDLGFMNLLVPHIETVEEASQVIAATRYPPYGMRGVSMSQRCNDYGLDKEYLESANQNICVMLQIETEKGVSNLPEILDVDGVDGVFIGPADLSASLGYFGEPSHPYVQEKMQYIFEKSVVKGIPVGTLAVDKERAEYYIKKGYGFVAVGTDQLLFRKAAQELYALFS